MRALTLDEKISLKGIFQFHGLTIPALDMQCAVFFWGLACGWKITKWHLYRNHARPFAKQTVQFSRMILPTS